MNIEVDDISGKVSMAISHPKVVDGLEMKIDDNSSLKSSN